MQGTPDEIDDRRLGPGRCRRWVATDRRANDGEDARSNNDPHAQCRKGYRTECLFERMFRALGVGDQFINGLLGKDLSSQRERS
jgi:hypothetical protein